MIAENIEHTIEHHIEQAITVRYKNWRGEIATRKIVPIAGSLRWGSTEWHPEKQWLLKVWDVERNDYREYALCDIIEFL